jgi:hypothetical protein
MPESASESRPARGPIGDTGDQAPPTMRPPPKVHAGPLEREDVAVLDATRTCSVCHRQRTRGSQDPATEIFVCAECHADAKQFIEIQDAICSAFAGADDATEPSHKDPYRQHR